MHRGRQLGVHIGIDPQGRDQTPTAPQGLARRRALPRPSRYSFGSTAAIVTSVGLIVGFGAASVPRSTIVSGLLIIAVADNISDSLSIHIYQESENLEPRDAFRATLTNFVARLLVALSFVGVVSSSPRARLPPWPPSGERSSSGRSAMPSRACAGWGPGEIAKHLVVAVAVMVVSRFLGEWIAAHVT